MQRLVYKDCTSNYQDAIEKEAATLLQNQAMSVFCRASASN